MAGFGNIILAGAAVSAISALGFIWGLSKSKKIKSIEDVKSAILQQDMKFVSHDFCISDDGLCAIAIAENSDIIILKSMGDGFATRKIKKTNITHNGDRLDFEFSDFTFPNFSAKFSQIEMEKFVDIKSQKVSPL